MAQPEGGSSTKATPAEEAEAFLKAHANEACDEGFFQCGAVALAIRLLGQYLFFHDSKIVIRILETEAYPEGDAVYTKKFVKSCDDVKLLSMKRGKLKGGRLLAWSPSTMVAERSEFKDLYITAGSPDNGDLVLIRSCEPILGTRLLLQSSYVESIDYSAFLNSLACLHIVSAFFGLDLYDGSNGDAYAIVMWSMIL